MVKKEDSSYSSLKLIAIVVLLGVIGWSIWYFFLDYVECDSWDCFNGNLADCSRTKFVGGSNMIFEYTIERVSKGYCEVNVRLLQGELNNQDSIRLERQEMLCFLPKGVVAIPEGDIGRCHGLLKEGLQDLVIEKLHTYLVQNLGQINLEMIDFTSNRSLA